MNWHHYLIDDLYSPIWPNIVASIIVAIWVYGRLKALERMHKRHHEEMKEHITNALQDRSGRRELQGN